MLCFPQSYFCIVPFNIILPCMPRFSTVLLDYLAVDEMIDTRNAMWAGLHLAVSSPVCMTLDRTVCRASRLQCNPVSPSSVLGSGIKTKPWPFWVFLWFVSSDKTGSAVRGSLKERRQTRRDVASCLQAQSFAANSNLQKLVSFLCVGYLSWRLNTVNLAFSVLNCV